MKMYARSDLVLVGFLGSVIAFAMITWSAERDRLTPPPTATTLAAFAGCMPAPQHLAAIKDAGATKIVWIGDLFSCWWSPASGPACYVFDSNGNLIQWDLETHEGQATTRYLKPTWEAESMTLVEAIDLVDGT